MEEKLPKSYVVEEINRLNGFFTLFAVPWALIGLVNIEVKSRQLTGFLFAFAFIVNLLLFIYFSGQLSHYRVESYDVPETLLIKKTTRKLNQVYLLLGLISAVALIVFIPLLHRPVYLTPLFLVITAVLFWVQRRYFHIQGERWIAPILVVMALVLIVLGDQYINWYSWGGFSGATIIWYVCLDRHTTVNLWLQEQGGHAIPPD